MAKTPRSEAQRAASRANGRKSAGPRTVAGKNRTRRNAIKHGLRAASLEILEAELDPPPLSLAPFSPPPLTLTDAVHARLAPVDAIEVELAEGIALAYWRLRRARQLEEALIEGRPDASAPNTLSRFLLRRNNAIDALGLLLRYRNQALGELARLGRLLEQHRRPAAASADSPEPNAPPTGVPASAAAGLSRSRRRQAANDNSRGDASDPICPLPRDDQGQETIDPAPRGPGSTVS